MPVEGLLGRSEEVEVTGPSYEQHRISGYKLPGRHDVVWSEEHANYFGNLVTCMTNGVCNAAIWTTQCAT